jgi:hypothetical protein
VITGLVWLVREIRRSVMEFKKGDVVRLVDRDYVFIIWSVDSEECSDRVPFYSDGRSSFYETELTLVCLAENREDGKERP